MKIFTMIFCLLSFCAYAVDEIRDSSTGETFPRTVFFEHNGTQYNLQTTGVATRKKFFVKVYSVAHYLQEGADSNSDKIQVIMNDNNAKQLTLKWVHEAGAQKVQDGYKESFKTALSESGYAQLQNEINKFVQFFNQDVKKGDEHILRWLPGGYVEVIINGNTAGSITNKDFAKGLWNIWFGTKSVVDRDKLISLMK